MRAAIVLVSVVVISACQQEKTAAPPSAPAVAPRAPQSVLGTDARTLIAAGAVLVDVRTVDEFNELHLDGARNMPLSDLGGAMASLPRDKPVIVYCAVGARSATAAKLLAGAGFDVRNLGAMENWNK